MAWVRIATVGELNVGEMKQIIVDDEELALYHLEDGFYVTSDVCTHARQSLTEGKLEGNIVCCPKHGGKFDVKTGAATSFPCVMPLQTYAVDIRNEEIWIDF